MQKFKYGDRVKIHSRFGGCYDGVKGTIINRFTTSSQAAERDETGFLAWHLALGEDWYRVRFDQPVNISTEPPDTYAKADAFSEDMMTKEEQA